MDLTVCVNLLMFRQRHCVTDSAGIWPIGCWLSPQSLDFDLRPDSHTQPRSALMFSVPIIHVITWITTHLPTPKGWKAELAWLVDPYWTLYPQSGHMSIIDQV